MVKIHPLFYAGLCFVAIVWGINFGVSRWAMALFPPEIFVFLRFGLAMPLLFIILKWTEGSVKVERRDLLMLAFIGLLGITALEIIVMYSIKFTTLANASLLNVAPWPIFVALLAPLFTREILTSRVVIGGIFALIGVVLIIVGGANGLDLSSKYMLGNLLALMISLFGAVYNLLCMPLMKKYSALRVTTWFIFFGVLFMFPATWGRWSMVEWTNLSMLAWSAVAYNVLFCTVAAFVIWNLCMYQVGATKANFYRYLVPAAATLAGALFFAEPIFPLQIMGAIIIVFGLVWISLEKLRALKEQEHTKAIILFDGVCNLCSSSVQFIINRDPEAYFTFASLQGTQGQSLLEHYELNEYFGSIILIENGRIYLKSTAALRICKNLRGFWKIFYLFIVIPAPLRNMIYNFIARNRYTWYGKKENCMLPSPEIRGRFLD